MRQLRLESVIILVLETGGELPITDGKDKEDVLQSRAQSNHTFVPPTTSLEERWECCIAEGEILEGRRLLPRRVQMASVPFATSLKAGLEH